jgi:predicted acetyltransferase
VAVAAGIEIRSPSADEIERFATTVMTGFGEAAHPEDVKRWQQELRPDRQYWAFDGDVPVGSAGTYDHRLSIPGGEVQIAAVTLVTVHPSHRRRGILRQLMRRQLDHAHELGEPVAALWASEGPIYPRFGYGVATTAVSISAERDRMEFRPPDEPAGRVRFVTDEEAYALFPPIYQRVQKQTPGMLARHESWWKGYRLADPEHWRSGAGPMFRAVWEDDAGKPQGYAMYRIRENWEGFIAASGLESREAFATTPQAWREIWRFLFGVDLIKTVKTWNLPPDHPLFLSVTEPRRLHASAGDGLFVRLLDLPAALEARSYAADGSVAFEVRDPFCSWNEGTWTLSADGGSGSVEQGGDPDLRLDVADLGSTYLGGWSLAALVRAGRVEELHEGAIERADELFRTPQQPWCPEVF